MILDSLANSSIYNSVNPLFKKAFAHIGSVDLKSLPEGKYEIEGEKLFFSIVERSLKTKEDALLEVHDKYIDIQIVISGVESFGWKDRARCMSPKGSMDTVKDILFFDDEPDTYPTISAGEFMVFFPGDAHAPLVGEGDIRKCIIKVLA